MSITIRDVAQAAGVSTATVSRALRGLPHVDPETRERVRRVAAELDYVVSPSASRLASGRTGTVAVITPFIDRWFFSTVLSGISDVLQESDVDLLVEFGERAWRRLECHDRADLLRGDKKHLGCVPLV